MPDNNAGKARKRPLNVSDVKQGRRRGRQSSGVEWVQLNTNIRPDQLHSLDALADRQNRSRNEIVREAIDQYVAWHDMGHNEAKAERNNG